MKPTLPAGTVPACLVFGLLAGCQGRPAPSPPVNSPPSAVKKGAAAPAATYKIIGVIKRVTPEAGLVVIAHQAIPGLMDAMTMPFTLKDRTLLDDLRPGDEVEGTLRVEKEGDVVNDYELEDLVVTKPAPAAPKVLTLSGNTLELHDAPKRLELGQEVPDFTMTTQEGRTQKLSDLRGKVVVLTFVYTRCPLPDFCPLMDRKFSTLAEKVATRSERAKDVRLLSLSFDPEHDTPEVLRKHAAVQGAKPPLWTFAVATHPELAKVAAPLGLTYGPMSNEIVHNLATAVIDRQGRLAQLDVGSSARTSRPTELLKLINSLR